MDLVKLTPIIKHTLWGGTYFSNFAKGEKDEAIAELWEVSVRPNQSSKVGDKDLIDIISKEDIGPVFKRFNRFPLLIKLIDANQNLSIQVHPNDEFALKNENSLGKKEAWYILDAKEGAGIYAGFKRDTSKEEVLKAIKDNTILDLLNFIKVKKGDVFMIEPGTVHAIGAGVQLFEIQENSDLTYRLYDYDRVDKNGQKRELHIDKSLAVLNYKKYTNNRLNDSLLIDNSHFKLLHKSIAGELKIEPDKDSFISFTILDGDGYANDTPYKKFDSFFLPYGKSCIIKGSGEVLISIAKL